MSEEKFKKWARRVNFTGYRGNLVCDMLRNRYTSKERKLILEQLNYATTRISSLGHIVTWDLNRHKENMPPDTLACEDYNFVFGIDLKKLEPVFFCGEPTTDEIKEKVENAVQGLKLLKDRSRNGTRS